MRKLKSINLILIAFAVTIFANCSSNNDSKITRLPQIIDQDTGLREFRFRRYDCLYMPQNETDENCVNNEEIVAEPRAAGSGQGNLRINELTPWLENKSRTVTNPTIIYNDPAEKLFITAYLRMNDAQNVQQNYQYKFEGDLKSFRARFRRTGEREYLRLTKKEAESSEIVNAVVFCFDNPTCKDITIVFSFLNYNSEGKSFIDSRPFQLDQREEPIVATDTLPRQAVRTIVEPVAEEPASEDKEYEEEYIDDGHTDPAFSAGPIGPALPQDSTRSLCEGLISSAEECPGYLLDASIPRTPEAAPSADANSLEPNPIESIVEIDQPQSPGLDAMDVIRPVDEQVFPAEARILSPQAPRLTEPNLDVLPIPNQTYYDTNMYHQFILRERQIREQALIDEKAARNIRQPIQDGVIPDSTLAAPPVEPDADVYSSAGAISPVRPRARPDNLRPSTAQAIPQSQDIPSAEDVAEVVAVAEEMSDSPLAVRTSLRPVSRPDGLEERYKALEAEQARLAAEEAARLAALAQQQAAAGIPFTSVDGRYTYDLGLCGSHLVKAKNIEYHQARGFYSNGSLRSATHFGDSDYEPNYPDPNRTNKHYSSEITKQILEFAGCVLEQRYGSNIKIELKNFSDHNGGRLGGHSSHQNGLDVDVSYPHLNGSTSGFDNFAGNMTNSRVGAALDYARLLLYTDRVHVMFTDNRIRARFCTYLREKGKLADFRNVVERYMYNVPRHHNHYHVRMKCNSQNEGCVVQNNFANDNYCSR